MDAETETFNANECAVDADLFFRNSPGITNFELVKTFWMDPKNEVSSTGNENVDSATDVKLLQPLTIQALQPHKTSERECSRSSCSMSDPENQLPEEILNEPLDDEVFEEEEATATENIETDLLFRQSRNSALELEYTISKGAAINLDELEYEDEDVEVDLWFREPTDSRFELIYIIPLMEDVSVDSLSGVLEDLPPSEQLDNVIEVVADDAEVTQFTFKPREDYEEAEGEELSTELVAVLENVGEESRDFIKKVNLLTKKSTDVDFEEDPEEAAFQNSFVKSVETPTPEEIAEEHREDMEEVNDVSVSDVLKNAAEKLAFLQDSETVDSPIDENIVATSAPDIIDTLSAAPAAEFHDSTEDESIVKATDKDSVALDDTEDPAGTDGEALQPSRVADEENIESGDAGDMSSKVVGSEESDNKDSTVEAEIVNSPFDENIVDTENDLTEATSAPVAEFHDSTADESIVKSTDQDSIVLDVTEDPAGTDGEALQPSRVTDEENIESGNAGDLSSKPVGSEESDNKDSNVEAEIVDSPIDENIVDTENDLTEATSAPDIIDTLSAAPTAEFHDSTADESIVKSTNQDSVALDDTEDPAGTDGETLQPSRVADEENIESGDAGDLSSKVVGSEESDNKDSTVEAEIVDSPFAENIVDTENDLTEATSAPNIIDALSAAPTAEFHDSTADESIVKSTNQDSIALDDTENPAGTDGEELQPSRVADEENIESGDAGDLSSKVVGSEESDNKDSTVEAEIVNSPFDENIVDTENDLTEATSAPVAEFNDSTADESIVKSTDQDSIVLDVTEDPAGTDGETLQPSRVTDEENIESVDAGDLSSKPVGSEESDNKDSTVETEGVAPNFIEHERSGNRASAQASEESENMETATAADDNRESQITAQADADLEERQSGIAECVQENSDDLGNQPTGDFISPQNVTETPLNGSAVGWESTEDNALPYSSIEAAETAAVEASVDDLPAVVATVDNDVVDNEKAKSLENTESLPANGDVPELSEHEAPVDISFQLDSRPRDSVSPPFDETCDDPELSKIISDEDTGHKEQQIVESGASVVKEDDGVMNLAEVPSVPDVTENELDSTAPHAEYPNTEDPVEGNASETERLELPLAESNLADVEPAIVAEVFATEAADRTLLQDAPEEQQNKDSELIDVHPTAADDASNESNGDASELKSEGLESDVKLDELNKEAAPIETGNISSITFKKTSSLEGEVVPSEELNSKSPFYSSAETNENPENSLEPKTIENILNIDVDLNNVESPENASSLEECIVLPEARNSSESFESRIHISGNFAKEESDKNNYSEDLDIGEKTSSPVPQMNSGNIQNVDMDQNNISEASEETASVEHDIRNTENGEPAIDKAIIGQNEPEDELQWTEKSPAELGIPYQKTCTEPDEQPISDERSQGPDEKTDDGSTEKNIVEVTESELLRASENTHDLQSSAATSLQQEQQKEAEIAPPAFSVHQSEANADGEQSSIDKTAEAQLQNMKESTELEISRFDTQQNVEEAPLNGKNEEANGVSQNGESIQDLLQIATVEMEIENTAEGREDSHREVIESEMDPENVKETTVNLAFQEPSAPHNTADIHFITSKNPKDLGNDYAPFGTELTISSGKKQEDIVAELHLQPIRQWKDEDVISLQSLKSLVAEVGCITDLEETSTPSEDPDRDPESTLKILNVFPSEPSLMDLDISSDPRIIHVPIPLLNPATNYLEEITSSIMSDAVKEVGEMEVVTESQLSEMVSQDFEPNYPTPESLADRKLFIEDEEKTPEPEEKDPKSIPADVEPVQIIPQRPPRAPKPNRAEPSKPTKSAEPPKSRVRFGPLSIKLGRSYSEEQQKELVEMLERPLTIVTSSEHKPPETTNTDGGACSPLSPGTLAEYEYIPMMDMQSVPHSPQEKPEEVADVQKEITKISTEEQERKLSEEPEAVKKVEEPIEAAAAKAEPTRESNPVSAETTVLGSGPSIDYIGDGDNDESECLDSIGDLSERTIQRFNTSIDDPSIRRDSFSSISSFGDRQKFRTAIENIRQDLLPFQSSVSQYLGPSPNQQLLVNNLSMDSPSDLSPNAPPAGFENTAQFLEKLQQQEDRPSAEGSIDSSGFEKVDHESLEGYGAPVHDPMQKSVFGSLTADAEGDDMKPGTQDDGFVFIERNESIGGSIKMSSPHDNVIEKNYFGDDAATAKLLESPIAEEARRLVESAVESASEAGKHDAHYGDEIGRELLKDSEPQFEEAKKPLVETLQKAYDGLGDFVQETVPQTLDNYFQEDKKKYSESPVSEETETPKPLVDISDSVDKVHEEIDNFLRREPTPPLVEADENALSDEAPQFGNQTPEEDETTFDRNGPLTIPEEVEKAASSQNQDDLDEFDPLVISNTGIAFGSAVGNAASEALTEEEIFGHQKFETVPRPPTPPKDISDEDVKPSTVNLGPVHHHSHPSSPHHSILKRHGAAWIDFKTVPPCVEDLVYWRDPKKSAVVLSLALVALFVLAKYPILSVVTYTLLLVLGAAAGFRIFKKIESQIKKTDSENPFTDILAQDLSLPQEKVHAQADVFVEHITYAANKLKKLVFVESPLESIKFGLILWSLTYIASWFSGVTLSVLAVLGVFSVPKVYESNKDAIDPHLATINGHLKNVQNLIDEKLPFLRSAPAVVEEKKDQ